MKKIFLIATVLSVQFFNAQTTEIEQASYAIGSSIALDMQKNKFDYDAKSIAQAFIDVKNGTQKIPNDSINPIIQRFMTKRAEQMKQEALKKEEEFLSKNKTNKKIKVTASGLQYEVIKESKDKTKPKSSEIAKVKYKGTLIDGTEFDSTEKQGGNPIDLPLTGVIPGFSEAIQLMNKGSIYKFYIPSKIGYGENPQGPIPANSTLIFEVELVDILPAPKQENTPPPPPPAQLPEGHSANDGHNH